MTAQRCMAACLALALLAGCVPSLHPLYTEKDLVFDPTLVGTWVQKDGKDTWQFEKAGEKSYTLTETDEKGRVGRFKAHLVGVKGHFFLDLYPDPEGPDVEMNALLAAHVVPAHLIFHVKQTTPTLMMRTLNPSWFKTFVEENPEAIKHERTDEGNVILTAKAAELQPFLVDHLKEKKAFGGWMTLTRRAKADTRKE